MNRCGKKVVLIASASTLLSIPSLQSALCKEYPYLYRSAYFLGRGDSGIAIANYEDAIFYNPAGVATGGERYKKTIFASPMIELSQDARDVIRQLRIQDNRDPTELLRKHRGKPLHVGANVFSGMILRRAAIGAFAHTSNTALLYKDHARGALETLHAESLVDIGAVFTLAHNFTPGFFAGITGKFIKRNRGYLNVNATEGHLLSSLNSHDDISMTGRGSGADIGLIYRPRSQINLALGLVIQDLGDTALTLEKKTDRPAEKRLLRDIPQTISIGTAIEFGTKYSKFRFLADFRDLTNEYGMSPYKRIHFGAELTFRNSIGFTAGLNQGYPSFGAYLDLKVLRLDVGAYGEEIGERAGSRPDTRFYFKLEAGV